MIGWLVLDAHDAVPLRRLVGVLPTSLARRRAALLMQDGSWRYTRTRPGTLRRRLQHTTRGLTGIVWQR